MHLRLVRVLVLLIFFSDQVFANPFGPNLPPVKPQPLPTTPAPSTSGGQGTNQPGLPTDPLNPSVPNGSGSGSSSSGQYGGGGLINLNYACPLVDQESNNDLLAALDILERAIQAVPECRNDSNLGNTVKYQQQMRNSALELRRLWNDQEHLSENLINFDNQLQTMVTGISFLAETLNNNTLLNSRCGKEMMTTGTALLAFSDLVTGIAPYALFAAAAASSLTVAVPYVMGVVGLASIVKIMAQASNSGITLDMNRYEHRQTVLKATCEYNRVATKIRYLKLAQSGQVEMLTREMNQINDVIFYDQQSLGSSLDEILKTRQEFYKKIDELRAQMYLDYRSYNELRAYLSRITDDSMACSLGMEIVENHRQGKFPISIDKNFKTLLEIGIPHNELTLRATSRQYEVAIKELEGNMNSLGGYRMGYCGQATHRFVGTLERILQTIEEELVSQEQLYEKKLSENASYKEWYTRTSTLEKDRETLKRVVKTMERASQDSSIMSKTELHQRMENLRNALFGSYDEWSWWPGNAKSPLENWLEHTRTMHARAIGLFNQSVKNLMDEVSQMRTKQHKKIKHVDETFSILPETFLYELVLVDINYENMNFINPRRFPSGSPQQEVMCQRLEEIWLNWAAALDHHYAIKHLCANIASFIDTKTGPGVVNVCGRRPIDGSVDTKSEIYRTEQRLEDKGFKTIALSVSKKLAELKCVGR